MNPLAIFEVFITMAKVGTVGFGGGSALISLIEREVVGVRAWVSPEHFQEIVGCSFAVPGLSAGKIAAFVGWEHAGVGGMLAALIGIWLPGMLALFALFYLLRGYRETVWYPKFRDGILFAATGLIAASIMVTLPDLPRGEPAVQWLRYALGLGMAVIVFAVLTRFREIPPPLAVIGAGLLGILVF